MHSSAHAKLIKARADLVLDHPFFASLALRLDLREDRTCATAWTNGRSLSFNPNYVAAMPPSKLRGMLCHEVLHLACCHHTRRGERDERLWNAACDYAINPILLEAGLELPSGFLDDPAHHGKSVDAIYKALADIEEERRGGYEGDDYRDLNSDESAEGGGESTSMGGEPDHAAAPGAPNTDEEAERGEAAAAGTASESGDPAQETADSGANSDPGMTGEVRDGGADNGGSRTEDSLRREEEDWRVAVSQAANRTREYGELPAGLERLIEHALTPTLPWTDILRRFLSDAARNDFSWMHPSRRYLHAGLYLPGLLNEELDDVAVAVDTSGSVSEAELAEFTGELSAVLEEFEATVNLLTCDTRVTSHRRLSRTDLPLELDARGGGGTDFRPPFAWLEDENIRPACMIYFTDLACDSFPEEPDYPVLWVRSGGAHGAAHHNDMIATPPFGEVVAMEPA